MTAVFLLLVLTAINAFFTASEMALISINDNKMRMLADEGHKKAKQLLKEVFFVKLKFKKFD
ncbi:MAG: CNNM domain-containing protein [Erysipelotrichaceae bacterium]|nr:CNNM domain-containing protein [Erysipelotrichaceae bacterium]